MNTTRIGSRLGRYRIDALLGHGRSGTVYDALDTESGREVALTLIEPPAGADAAYRERFRSEARRAAALDHPNIAQLHEAGEIDGELFAAAEYVDGEDLRTLVRTEGPLAPARALFILQQAAHALDAAAAAGIRHRELDATTILVERHSDHVYVVDFGLGPEPPPPLVPALGGVLEELFTGQEIPPALEAVVAKALDPAAEDGYATGGELVRAARAALRGTAAMTAVGGAAASSMPTYEPYRDPWRHGPEHVGAGHAARAEAAAGPLRPVPLAGPERQHRRRRVWPILVGTAALLGLVGLLVLVMTHGKAHPSGQGTASTTAPTATGSRATTFSRETTTGAATRPRGQAAVLLAQIHDPAIRRSCSKAKHPGGLATLLCSSTAADGSDIDLHVDHFGKPGIVLEAFRNEAIAALVAAGGKRPATLGGRTGRCDATTWLGAMSWPRAGAGSGYAACFVVQHSAEDCGRLGTGPCAVVYWSYEPENLYLRAAAAPADAAQLYAWWVAHRDRFGA